VRFAWAKGDKTCRQCGKKIERGEHQIHITLKNVWGYWYHYYYHQEHYLEYLDWFINNWFKKYSNTQKKLGRKSVITYDREKRRRLMALYRYYRSKSNIARMQEVNEEIKRLSYGVSPYELLQ